MERVPSMSTVFGARSQGACILTVGTAAVDFPSEASSAFLGGGDGGQTLDKECNRHVMTAIVSGRLSIRVLSVIAKDVKKELHFRLGLLTGLRLLVR